MKKLHTLVLLLACTLAVGCSSGGDDPIDDPKPTPTPTPLQHLVIQRMPT